jgi:hypothetical protein
MGKKRIGTRSQARGRKKAAKQYANKKGKASLYTMKQKDATTKFGYKRGKTKLPKQKIQKPTTKTGRKSLKK